MNAIFENTFLTLAILVLLAVGLSLCTYLFAVCKREIWTTRCAVRAVDETVAALSVRLLNEVGSLSTRVRATEDRSGMLVPPAPPPSGLNLARRAQAVRMLRHGAEVASIASALSVPPPEIELLARVQALIARSADSGIEVS